MKSDNQDLLINCSKETYSTAKMKTLLLSDKRNNDIKDSERKSLTFRDHLRGPAELQVANRGRLIQYRRDY